jgi:hypothetical protein
MAGSKASKKDKKDKDERASQSAKSAATGATSMTASQTASMLSASTRASQKGKGPKVDVPYGQAYPLERQTKMTVDQITFGLREVLQFMNAGQKMVADQTQLTDHVARLGKQGDKILEALGKDQIYIEEVRHHHNRISDLCDDTRSYSQEMMLSDLKRASHIRQQVLTIVQGKAPDYELDQDEQDDLKTVRNMLRRQFGGKKTKKGADLNSALPFVGVQDQEVVGAVAGDIRPSEFKARTSAAGDMFAAYAHDATEEAMREEGAVGNLYEEGWASDLVNGARQPKMAKQ